MRPEQLYNNKPMKITNSAGIYETLHNNKQAFHACLFNIRNYSPEVINIRRYLMKRS